jgi:hypothetical protein
MFVTTREVLYSALRAVQPFMSKDETRPHMDGVRIEFADGECHLIASDGAALAHVQLVRPIGERAPSDGWGFLTAEQVQTAIKLVKPKAADRAAEAKITIEDGADDPQSSRPRGDYTQISIDGDQESRSFPRAETAARITSDLETVSSFPPWRQVTPPREHVKKPAAFVGIGSRQLERAGKACKAFLPAGVDRGFVVRQPSSELEPVRLDTDHPDRGSLTIVIMPMRV